MKAPLRMLVLGSRWPPESFLERLLQRVASKDLQIWIAQRKRVEIEHAHIHHFPMPIEGLLGKAQESVWAMLGWMRTGHRPRMGGVLRQSWDLLYFPWNSGAVSCLPLMKVGIPSIVSCRGSQILIAPHVPGRQALTESYPEMFEHATVVHCVSQDILAASVSLGLDARRARVITPAVDEQVYFPLSKRSPREGPLQVLGLGTLIWRKGFEDALLAVAQLRDRGVEIRYHLVGEGRDRQRLQFAVRDLGLEQQVTFHGSMKSQEIPALMQRCDAFLLSSVCEGISNAALEAMSCGLAVVSTRCGGMEEAIEDQKHGLLVPARDPAAMADALERLASNHELLASLGQAARTRVQQSFRLDDQAEAFRELCFTAVR